MTKLWLDDIRRPWMFGRIGYEWVKTADEAIEALRRGDVEFASLDHDLGWEQTLAGMRGEVCDNAKERSGYDVVCWLEQNPEFWPPLGVEVHSANPAGKARMEVVIRRHYENLRA